MKKSSIIMITSALLLAACAEHRSKTNDLELGMTRAEVRALMGEPDSTAAVKGKGDCYYYSLWRDFWNRIPGSYSDRYYACFQKDKLAHYGRVGDPV